MLAALVAPAMFPVVTGAAPASPRTSRTPVPSTPVISTETLPSLLQHGANAFASGDFAGAADAFGRVESAFGTESEWVSGALPRRLLPLRGFAELRIGRASDAAASLAEFLDRFPDETSQRGFALYALALALQQSNKPDEALARFAAFEAEHPGTAQAALARLQRASILFDADRADDGFTILRELADSPDAAESLRTQARLQALEKAVALKQDPLAEELLLGQPWSVSTMPEIAVLAFAAMEMGDRMLATGRADIAVQAFRLVLPKRHLVAAQRVRLEELKRLYAERAPSAAAGSGAFWADFYRARINRIDAQLAGLEAAEDYSWPLRLRLGQALLLAHRGREAWLCFESVTTAQDAGAELRREGHYRWILAAAELEQWDDALVIARDFVTLYPASDLAPEALFLISRAHLEQQRYTDAEQVLTDILERFPTHPASSRSRFMRGWVRTMNGDYPAARDDFEQCIAAAPTSPLAAQSGLWLGLTYFFAREHAAALEVFDTLAHTHAGDAILPEVVYRRATTLYAMRNFPRARKEMEMFVTTYSMHVRHPEALVLLGDILMGEGDLDAARRRFDEVPVEHVDSFVYAAFQTGKILRAQAKLDIMVEHFSEFVRRATNAPLPRVSEALYWIGWAEEQRGHPEAALPVYAEALKRFGNDPSAREVGTTLAALQKLARRIARSNPASHSQPGMQRLVAGDFEGWVRDERERANDQHQVTYHARLTVALADLHLARKEPAQAELLLLGLAGSAPLDALDAATLARVGQALASIGSDDATACFQHMLAVYGRSVERAVAFHGLANIATQQRRFVDALAWTARFESETPAHPLAPHVALLTGSALEATGRPHEAAERYDALLRLKSARGRPHAEALAGLARCSAAEGDPAKAVAYYQRIYTLYRAQHDLVAVAYLESAPLFEHLGDLPSAAATYREMLALAEIGDDAQRTQAQRALATLEEQLAPAPGDGTGT